MELVNPPQEASVPTLGKLLSFANTMFLDDVELIICVLFLFLDT